MAILLRAYSTNSVEAYQVVVIEGSFSWHSSLQSCVYRLQVVESNLIYLVAKVVKRSYQTARHMMTTFFLVLYLR